LHLVDEDAETVYVLVDSWMGSISAPHWVNRHYPGYKSKATSRKLLEKMLTEND
jgi:hypothetical protein